MFHSLVATCSRCLVTSADRSSSPPPSIAMNMNAPGGGGKETDTRLCYVCTNAVATSPIKFSDTLNPPVIVHY